MKKLFVILFLTLAVGFTACSDDEDNDYSGNDIENPKGTVIVETKAGELREKIETVGLGSETKLAIKGEMDARDFAALMTCSHSLVYLNLMDVDFVAYYNPEIKREYEADVFYEEYIKNHGVQGVVNRYPELKTIILPKGLTVIDYSVFSSLFNLEKVIMFDNVAIIRDFAFNCCCALSELRLSRNLIKIGQFALSVTGLKNIILPEKLEVIGYYAFDSTLIEEIVIPKSVKQIEDDAFGANLKTIYFKNPVPLDYGTYDYSKIKNIDVYVPKGSKAAYETHKVWGQAKEIIEE